MSLTSENENGMVMPVMPMGGGYGNGGGFGMDGNGWWIILLFILLGGWGNGWNNGGNCGGNIGGTLYPWMNQSDQVNDGFRDLMTHDTITSIYDGVHNLSTQLCNSTSDVQMALANGFAGVEQGANARQMANMQQAFAAQTAMSQGFSGVQSQLAQCCCDNRLGTADLKYTIATENCADRAALSDGVRDLMANQTANTQAILDKLCALELDGVKNQLAQAQRENVGLQNQLNMATLRESQTAQNAFIAQGLTNEVDALYNRLNNCPVATVPVYGRQPIFTCNQNGCGCGCGA